ncbi:MAG TPA: ABC transporter permease [Bryobacteraceae bacterium]|jgi:predicted permease|nr:ABC transporter permease [Bryobacteraceae bacterium]
MKFLSYLFHRRRIETEMDAELRFHIDSFAADLVRQGASREEALRRARIEFGGIEVHKEECRESLGLRLWDELRGDCRYALRMMRQNPGFTAVAVISLGLGIGANTAIFTFAKEILLTTMAVPHSERLRMLNWEVVDPKAHFPGPVWGSLSPSLPSPFPYRLYQDMRRHNEVMDDLVAFKDVYHLSATVNGQAEPVDGMLVSGNFYQSLAPRMIAGRPIAQEDDSLSASPVVVISDAYWSRRFGRSVDALGKVISLNRVPVTIVGVNAPEFKGAKAGGTYEIFLPLSLQGEVLPVRDGSLLAIDNYWWLMIIGRLKPGVTDQAANAALEVSFRNSFRAAIRYTKDIPRFSIIKGSRGMDRRQLQFTKPIYLLLALAGLVLLIACANLANLLLARSSTRQREMSLRLAMGASRPRVMRQVLTEAMLLAVLGGGAGLLLGYWGRNLIPSLFDDSWHQSGIDPQMDWRVFAFAFAITLITGLLFGVAPAWRCTRADVNSGLKETGRMSTSRPKAFLGKALVVFQVSLSLLLLIGAGLFLRTLLNLRTTTIGFNPEHILLFDINPPRSQYPWPKGVLQQIEEKIAALPSVQSVTMSAAPLLANSMDRNCFRPTGYPSGPAEQDPPWTNSVGPNFFETFAIPILNGRSFTARDNQNVPEVAIVNRRFAKEVFPNENPVGRTITSCEPGDNPAPIEIVGVSEDAKYSDIRAEAPPTIYFSFQQNYKSRATFALKTAASTTSIVAGIRESVRSVDKDLPIQEVRTQTQQIEASLSSERAFAILTTGFGLLALILASIGIYGIMAYTVSRRTNEIGIRMALGARSSQVLSMVLRETFLLAFIGIAVGLAAAAALTRLAASMLYNLKPTDPATFGAAALLLVIIALAAGFTPARRASRVDPMHALRHE